MCRTKRDVLSRAAKDEREKVRSGSLNRVTRPAGDNDIYARQVYDVWSATHELRVGRVEEEGGGDGGGGVKARKVQTFCPENVPREILARACHFRESAISKVSHIFNVAAIDLRSYSIHRDLCKIPFYFFYAR